MEADGAPFTSSLCQCSILRVFKAIATQIREKSKQTLESLRIELETSSTEGSALSNFTTRLRSFFHQWLLYAEMKSDKSGGWRKTILFPLFYILLLASNQIQF